jgi:hypothetical protein
MGSVLNPRSKEEPAAAVTAAAPRKMNEAGQRAERDVVVALQIAGIRDDDAKADRQGEENLARGVQPHLRVRQHFEEASLFGARVPHEAEAAEHVRQREHAQQHQQGTDDQSRHGQKAKPLDAAAEPPVDEHKVQYEAQAQKHQRGPGQRRAVFGLAHKPVEQIHKGLLADDSGLR